MTCLSAGVDPHPDAWPEERVRALLRGAAWRGSEQVEVKRFDSGGFLGVARDRWEMEDDVASPVLMGRAGPVVVGCDASLYFRSDLLEKLKKIGHPPVSLSPADLIAAAYLAYGEACVLHLEGDYAFCAWNTSDSTLFAARDVFGTRSLFYRTLGSTILMHSSATVLAGAGPAGAPAPYPAFDEAGVFSALSGIPGDGSRTAWKGILELPAGHFVTAGRGDLRVHRFAGQPELWATTRPPREEAAGVVGRQILASVAERSPSVGASLALSGGQDSSAVLAGLKGAGSTARQRDLALLSIDYPEGDPGFERPWIESAARHFSLDVQWVGYDAIRTEQWLDRPQDHHSHPGRYPFNGVQQALATRAIQEGHRVLLTGRGGDNQFSTSPSMVLAEHFRRFRPIVSARLLWAHRPIPIWRAIDTSVRINLHPDLGRRLEHILGRTIIPRPAGRSLPEWIRTSTEEAQEILLADQESFDSLRMETADSPFEGWRAWALLNYRFSRFGAALFDDLRFRGVELRSPLLDLRLARLIRSFPPSWMYRPLEPKALLRDAMRPYLPHTFLEIRNRGLRTGTAQGLMREIYVPELLRQADVELARPEEWLTEEMGLIRRDPLRVLLQSKADLDSGGWASLLRAISSERWLKARLA